MNGLSVQGKRDLLSMGSSWGRCRRVLVILIGGRVSVLPRGLHDFLFPRRSDEKKSFINTRGGINKNECANFPPMQRPKVERFLPCHPTGTTIATITDFCRAKLIAWQKSCTSLSSRELTVFLIETKNRLHVINLLSRWKRVSDLF